MALRSNSAVLRSMVSHFTRKTTFATSTTPKMKPQVAAAADYAHRPPETKSPPLKGAFMPVYVAVGMIMLQVSFGLFTIWHQLNKAPNVCLKKSRRETVVEVMEPEYVAEQGDKFIKESFFRKIAHIQDYDYNGVIPDPIRKDIYAQQPRAITLKDVGVDPRKDSGRVESKPTRH